MTGVQTCALPISLRRVQVGDWVKKLEDGIEKYVQVTAISPVAGPTAVSLTLAQPYGGISGSARGVALSQDIGADAGVSLSSMSDIRVFEGDSAFAGDSMVIENIVNVNWFNTSNSGVKVVSVFATSSSHTQGLRVANANGFAESNRLLSVKPDGLYILESEDYTYETVREVHNTAISAADSSKRSVFLKPEDRIYKMSDLYQTKVSVIGKIGAEVSIITGVDGYSYYVGLMRTVQRIIDGFEPDAANFPGRRAVGSIIEVLPPLIRAISLAINVTTRDGVNLTDITNDIKSSVIGYVSSLGVGEDVVLSEIIARVMGISGVAAVTFTRPLPSTERIAVADDAKAFIAPESISIS